MKPGRVMLRAALPLLAAVLLAACASKPKPQPLEPLTPKIAGKAVWNQSVDKIQFPLSVVVNRGAFIVAGGDGTVLALQADTGKELWRGNAGDKLSAGVGSDGRFAAVVTREGELVTLDQGQPSDADEGRDVRPFAGTDHVDSLGGVDESVFGIEHVVVKAR